MKRNRKIVRCKNCNRFLCEVEVTLENPPAGQIAKVHKLICKKCGYENSGDVSVEEVAQN